MMGLRMRRCVGRALLCAVLAGGMALGAAAAKPTWEAEAAQTRPWVYNWWMGSAVTEAGLEAQARALAEGGLGGFDVVGVAWGGVAEGAAAQVEEAAGAVGGAVGLDAREGGQAVAEPAA